MTFDEKPEALAPRASGGTRMNEILFIMRDSTLLRTIIALPIIMMTVSIARATDVGSEVSSAPPGWKRPYGAEVHAVEKDDSIGFITRITNSIKHYFEESNKPKDFDKKVDFSIIGGPHYSSETKFGIGLVAAANYRADRTDSLTTPSFVGLYGDLTTSGSWYVGVKGTHIFPHDIKRIDYSLGVGSTPTDFWGIGFVNGDKQSNKTKYDNFYCNLRANFMWRLAKGFYLGPGIEADYFQAKNVKRPELWDGQRFKTTTFGVSVKAQFDTRDNLTFPRSGWLVALSALACPRFLGNHYAFSMIDINACYYRSLWSGGVLAAQVHSAIGFDHIPWGMLPTFGGSYSMRGYYDGRYRDKREADMTAELRQHVYGRSSVAVWVGAATVFSDFNEIRWKRILPNAGLGYRWEFKKNTNVRLDFGFGKRSTGFVFSINEAF